MPTKVQMDNAIWMLEKQGLFAVNSIRRNQFYDARGTIKTALSIVNALISQQVKDNDFWSQGDRSYEWICAHGVGHPKRSVRKSLRVHGCDGCCSREDFPKDAKPRKKK